ncbi:ATP-binding protein [Myxococcus sp. CA033]|nr:ATP-binding protein [Myxococcus sp. CA033]
MREKLRLAGVPQSPQLRTQRAVDDPLPHSDFLSELPSDTVDCLDSEQLSQHVRHTSCEDANFNPSGAMHVWRPGAPRQSAHRRPPPLRKSHLTQDLGHGECRAGYSTLHLGTDKLLMRWGARVSWAATRSARLRFTSPDLPIIDDRVLRGLSQDEPVDLYEGIRQWYARKSRVTSPPTERLESDLGVSGTR